jgi:hypothetical protein
LLNQLLLISSMWKQNSVIIFMMVVSAILGCGGSDSSKSSATGPVSGLEPADAETLVIGRTDEDSDGVAESSIPPDILDETILDGPIEMEAYEINADLLLSAVLPKNILEDGWVRLFDGHTLAGWSIVGQADWQCREGILRVTRGEKSFLCTNFEIADFELKVDFRCSAKTNSGVFLRTTPEPIDVSLDCIEVNIAPPENPFPTGSLVGRQRLDPSQLGDFDPTQWHTYLIKLDGESVVVQLDGRTVMEAIDDTSSRRGHISLQFNEGVVEFRNILMRPIKRDSLSLDADWQNDWIVGEKEPGSIEVVPSSSGLRITGGLGKVQSRQSYGDFWLQTRYRLASPNVNSGIFFRCVEDTLIDGYECQINHSIVDGDPLRPADAGAGAIFRRRPARIVIGDGTASTYLSLLASGNQLVTWVNGLMAAEFYDDRPQDSNPRRGSRTDPGPIALQGHDSTTEITFEQMHITELR